jgi:hypothetical protein
VVPTRPRDKSVSDADAAKMTAEAFAMMDATDRQTDRSKNPAMHETPAINVIIVIRGPVRLLVDEGDRLLCNVVPIMLG